MYSILNTHLVVYNKLFVSSTGCYLLITSILFLLYIYHISSNNFFKIIINFLFVVDAALIVSYLDADFFSAFLLAAELPIILILIIFYFHKNSLQLNNPYKYDNNVSCYKFILFVSLLIIFSVVITNFFSINTYMPIFNFLVNGCLTVASKNDFLLLFLVYYKINNIYIYQIAVLIFLVSLLAIFIYQLNKFFLFRGGLKYRNILILRKQSLVKQGIFKLKVKFYSKKV